MPTLFIIPAIIERMGTGIQDMTSRCVKYGLPEPEFKMWDGFVTIIYRKKGIEIEAIGEVVKKSSEESSEKSSEENLEKSSEKIVTVISWLSKVFLHTDNTDLTDKHGFYFSDNQLKKFIQIIGGAMLTESKN